MMFVVCLVCVCEVCVCCLKCVHDFRVLCKRLCIVYVWCVF